MWHAAADSERCPQMVRVKEMLLRLLDIMELPPNPLDQLTDLMGGEAKVAEMTGRKGLMKREPNGTVSYQRRCPEVSPLLGWPPCIPGHGPLFFPGFLLLFRFVIGMTRKNTYQKRNNTLSLF